MLSSEGYVVSAARTISSGPPQRSVDPASPSRHSQGITRDTVMDLVRSLGLRMREEVFTCHDVYTADECFLTGTGAEVGAVVEVDGRRIAEGVPGGDHPALAAGVSRTRGRAGDPIYTPATAERRR